MWKENIKCLVLARSQLLWENWAWHGTQPSFNNEANPQSEQSFKHVTRYQHRRHREKRCGWSMFLGVCWISFWIADWLARLWEALSVAVQQTDMPADLWSSAEWWSPLMKTSHKEAAAFPAWISIGNWESMPCGAVIRVFQGLIYQCGSRVRPCNCAWNHNLSFHISDWAHIR